MRESIAQQQCESEKFISWVQLLLVVTFGILYALAPSSAPEVGVQPVPWILSAYFIFTMVRLIGSHRGQLPNWLLMASEVMDIVLLMVLIWSFHIFHIQYMQPASFYLKAPTMVYVFIFIALRALRFEPRFIILSGAAAEDLSRFVSAEVADRITSADRAIHPATGNPRWRWCCSPTSRDSRPFPRI